MCYPIPSVRQAHNQVVTTGNRIRSAVVSGESAKTNYYVSNLLNQYTLISNQLNNVNFVSYDADGNILTNGAWSYVWDAENRLVSVSSNGVLVLINVYDYRSRRVAKITEDECRHFLYDGWNVIGETVGGVTNMYVWGLDMSGTMQGANGLNGLLVVAKEKGSTPTLIFPIFDASGNISCYVNESGSSVASIKYDVFGNVMEESNAFGPDLPFMFRTKYCDREIGLHWYGYRYYAPDIGRWISRDPLADISFSKAILSMDASNSPDLYVFCKNQPNRRYSGLSGLVQNYN